MTALTIGWIGPGLMGRGMAKNLVKAGHDVAVFARSNQAALDVLVAMGARRADSLEEIAACPVIGMCVTDASAVESVIDALLPRIAKDTLVVDATTSFPATSVAVANRLADHGARFADAPVTGGPKQADEGVLGSLVGCREADFDEVEAVVGCYSASVRRIGEVSAGNSAKLLNNFVSQGQQALLAECFSRAKTMGVDSQALYDVMMLGNARSNTLERAVGPTLEGRYDGTQFALANAYKDLRYYCDVAAAGEGLSPLGAAVRGVLRAACDAGHSERFVPSLHEPEISQAVRATWTEGDR